MSATPQQPPTTTDSASPSRLDQPADAVAMQPIADEAAPAAATAASNDNNEPSQTATPAAADDGPAPEPPSKEDPQQRDRQDSMAIGPDQGDPKAASAASAGHDEGGNAAGPVCNITLLLTSGSRHPYKINARYLSRRNVPIPGLADDGSPDPFSISVYTLKELILREWRSDWEAKPSSPSSIRLIHFGKLLDDKEALKGTHSLSCTHSLSIITHSLCAIC